HAVGDDGVGRLEEEGRVAAFGFRGRCGRAHFTGVVGEVASYAVDAAYREHAAVAHRHARLCRGRNDIVHGPVQRSRGWPGLVTTLYSASTTRASAACRRP